MKLYHRDVLLAHITSVSPDGVWMNGDVEFTPQAAPFQSFFSFMTDGSKSHQDPPFAEDLLEDDNWFIEDAAGARRGITMRAIHKDKTIEWRWR
jgi:hypothetical protein